MLACVCCNSPEVKYTTLKLCQNCYMFKMRNKLSLDECVQQHSHLGRGYPSASAPAMMLHISVGDTSLSLPFKWNTPVQISISPIKGD